MPNNTETTYNLWNEYINSNTIGIPWPIYARNTNETIPRNYRNIPRWVMDTYRSNGTTIPEWVLRIYDNNTDDEDITPPEENSNLSGGQMDMSGDQTGVIMEGEVLKVSEKEFFDLLKEDSKKKKSIIKPIDPHIKCQCCQNIVKLSDIGTITNIKYVTYCKTCLSKNKEFRICENCGNYYNIGLKCGCTWKYSKDNALEQYNHHHLMKYFKTKDNESLFFGIETEIEIKTTEFFTIPDPLEWFYYKRDGSINNGYEIVTYPLSWKWIKENQKTIIDFLKSTSTFATSMLTDTCGMHIHISKSAMSTYHLYKFIEFFRRNQDYMCFITNRTWTDIKSWASFDSINKKESAKNIAIYKRQSNRHSAINLHNAESIEIRIFKGTLRPEIYFKNIEFVKALVDFTRYEIIKNLDVNNFESFVNKNKQEYPYLYKYVNILLGEDDSVRHNRKAKG